MPELRFTIRWPDGTRELCYSPSTIIQDHFDAGTTYPLEAFVQRSRTALCAASERVRERYGTPCSLAMAQLARMEAHAMRFRNVPGANVIVESFQI